WTWLAWRRGNSLPRRCLSVAIAVPACRRCARAAVLQRIESRPTRTVWCAPANPPIFGDSFFQFGFPAPRLLAVLFRVPASAFRVSQASSHRAQKRLHDLGIERGTGFGGQRIESAADDGLRATIGARLGHGREAQ